MVGTAKAGAPVLDPTCERLEAEFLRPTHPYVKIRGVWHYLYRAVDRMGRTVDFRLSTRRDVAAAKAFFRKAIKKSAASTSNDHAGRIRCISPCGA